MYSYEDRLRAVQLYIKLDKRIGLTIFQLGYPTKNALKTWYHEYEQSHDLAARLCAPAEVLQGPEGTGRRALPRARTLHRSDDQISGLSLEVIAVRVDSRAASAGARGGRWSISGTGACS